MKRLATAMSLALFAGACADGRPSADPIAPTATRTPDPTFTMSGVVVADTATGTSPVEGVEVSVAGKRGATERNGAYRITDVSRSYGGVSAVKAGYAAARKIVTISADTQLDFQLGPRIAINTLSGVVSESTPAGRVPVEGVLVGESSCEAVSPAPPFWPSAACPARISQTTRTDRRGFYSFAGLYGGKENFITISKDGYVDPSESEDEREGPGGQAVVITGDTRVDINIVRR